MSKRENCEHRHTNGNCLFNGGFCLANDEEHCVRINEIKSYNQALEDFEVKIKECCSIVGSCDYEDMERIKEQLKR